MVVMISHYGCPGMDTSRARVCSLQSPLTLHIMNNTNTSCSWLICYRKGIQNLLLWVHTDTSTHTHTHTHQGFTSVVLSTIERRYQFSSTVAGFIASTFDISVFVSVLFISYFGGKGHKPRWLGVSLIVQGLGESHE